jgi:hypothetical protein
MNIGNVVAVCSATMLSTRRTRAGLWTSHGYERIKGQNWRGIDHANRLDAGVHFSHLDQVCDQLRVSVRLADQGVLEPAAPLAKRCELTKQLSHYNIKRRTTISDQQPCAAGCYPREEAAAPHLVRFGASFQVLQDLAATAQPGA